MFRDIDLFWFYDIFHLTIIVSLYSSTNNIFRGVDGVPFSNISQSLFSVGEYSSYETLNISSSDK